MQRQSVLPLAFRPKRVCLTRIGRNHDGGYLVDLRNIDNTDVLVGLGVNDDWSFEEGFYSRKKIPIYAYDGTIGRGLFLSNLLKALAYIHHPRIALHWLDVLRGYTRFFRGDRRHITKLVGIDLEPDFISFKTLVSSLKLPPRSRMFLKVDIEGWEYRLLDDLVSHSSMIEGMVIEFHDVDLHLQRIEAFIGEFPLSLVHVHCNNFAPATDRRIPLAIECTFTSRTTEEFDAVVLPHELDMPNKAGAPDYTLTFA